MSARGKKLSSAQMAMLKRIREHGDPWRGLRGRSQFGGAEGTIRVLKKEGLITDHGGVIGAGWALTIDGNRAMRLGHVPA